MRDAGEAAGDLLAMVVVAIGAVGAMLWMLGG